MIKKQKKKAPFKPINIFIPAARSRTATLLRLHPGYEFHNHFDKPKFMTGKQVVSQ